MASGSKRKASGDLSDDGPTKKRAKTTDELQEQLIQAKAALADLASENTQGAQQEDSAPDTDEGPEGQPEAVADTVSVDDQQDEEVIDEEDGSSGSEHASAEFPSPSTANKYAANSFCVGDVILVPLIHPYLEHDEVIRGVAEQWSDEFTSEDVGKFKKSLTPAIIVAIYTTNMMVLPVLDGRLNSERKTNKQANLNMSLDVVRKDSIRNVPDDSEFSRAKLVLEYEEIENNSNTSSDEGREAQAWQPPAGAHVHFAKPVPAEYFWPNKVLNRLTDACTEILVDRYAFVHGTLLKTESSKAEAKLLAYIKKETKIYGEGLGGDEKPVDPPPVGVEENDNAPPADRPGSMVRGEKKANDASDGDEDDDDDDGNDPALDGAPIRKGTTGGKTLPTVRPTRSKKASGNPVRGDPATNIKTNTKKPGKNTTKKPSDNKKGGKKAGKGQDDDDDDDQGDEDDTSKSDSEGESDSDSDSEQYTFVSGGGKSSRKVKLNGLTRHECSHACKVKFRPESKTPCGHTCCSSGLSKRPQKQKVNLPFPADNDVPVINWPGGADKDAKPGVRKSKPPSPPKKGVAKTTKKGSRVQASNDMDGFVVPDGQPSPPQQPKNKGKGKEANANKDDEDDDADEDEAASGKGSKKKTKAQIAADKRKAAAAARAKEMEDIGAEPEGDSDDEEDTATTKPDAGKKGKAAASATATQTTKKKPAKKTTSRQGSTKASTTSGADKKSARAPGPRKNQTSQTLTTSKARSGSGSAAASTAARKPSGSRPSTRSGSAAPTANATAPAAASATANGTSSRASNNSDDGKVTDPIDRAILGYDPLDERGNQIKVKQTKTDTEKGTAETNAKTGSQTEENSKTESKDKTADKGQNKSDDKDEDTNEEQEGIPDEIEDLLAETNTQPQIASNQVPTPEPVTEEDEDPWKARSEALAAEREDVEEADSVTPAVSVAPNDGFALPVADYLGEVVDGQESNAYGGGEYDSEASGEE